MPLSCDLMWQKEKMYKVTDLWVVLYTTMYESAVWTYLDRTLNLGLRTLCLARVFKWGNVNTYAYVIVWASIYECVWICMECIHTYMGIWLSLDLDYAFGFESVDCIDVRHTLLLRVHKNADEHDTWQQQIRIWHRYKQRIRCRNFPWWLHSTSKYGPRQRIEGKRSGRVPLQGVNQETKLLLMQKTSTKAKFLNNPNIQTRTNKHKSCTQAQRKMTKSRLWIAPEGLHLDVCYSRV